MSLPGANDALLIGYARASRSIPGDLAGQVQALRAAGVDAEHIWTDWGLAGRGLHTPGRDQALDTARNAFAVHRQTTTLILTDWARFAHSAGDLHAVLHSLSEIPLTIVVDDDPYGAVRLQQLVAALEVLLGLEADLVQYRAAERATQPAPRTDRGAPFKLTVHEEDRIGELYDGGVLSPAALQDLFGISKASLYRIVTGAGSDSTRDSDT